MADHPLVLVYAALAAIVTAVVAAIATRVQLLPDVIDLSLIPTGSGLGSLALVYLRRAAARRPRADRPPLPARHARRAVSSRREPSLIAVVADVLS